MKILKYPIEYFEAQVMFAKKISEIRFIQLNEAFLEYTDLYHLIVNKEFGEKEGRGIYDSKWLNFLSKTNLNSSISEIAVLANDIFKCCEDNYIELPDNTDYSSKDEKQIGCFSISFNEYNLSKLQIKLHFRPKRVGISFKDQRRQGEPRKLTSTLPRHVTR